MTSRRRLTEWLGEDATDSEALITTLHELLTGAYELDVFKSDVAAYDIEERGKGSAGKIMETIELITYVQERGLLPDGAIFEDWMHDRTDMLAMVKDDIQTLEDLNDDCKYDVLSPNGISIHHEDFYDSPEAAKIALTAWVKRYERQGYYSSIKHGRIPLEKIKNYCSIVPI